ncbi:ADP-ribosylglycohydrolase family protein [Ralstonia pseudosolanacearum]|uniref:ADP-ribosylglycohydrolase family protein n=1 Tax=Ralstonia pseudosolanacearum TaxID=1310165 RepID=UPI001FFA2143|nr:ADP-ribosylglycohydrolase family protein [Ralstonia pseudosolanacearum]
MTNKNSENNGFASLLSDHSTSSIVGGLVGVLVGDALGVPYEFHPPEDLPRRDLIEMEPPTGFHCAHSGVPAGYWSDDGSQTLCLLASLLECGKFSLPDFADRLLRWYDEGYLAVDGHVYDIGLQTADALDRLRDGVLPTESGGTSVRDNGNGSLMRVLPLALWHTGTDEDLVHDAHSQSLVTHAHPRSLVACGLYVLVARGYLHQLADPWGWADNRLEEIYNGFAGQEGQALLRELDVLRSFAKTNKPKGSGYVLDTIWSTRMAMEEETFEDVVKTAILFGHDTDTTAAVSAGLAGLRHSLEGIPVRWLATLRGFELAGPLITKFMDQKTERKAGRSLVPEVGAGR